MIRGSDWGGSRLATAQTCKQKYYNRYLRPNLDGGSGIIQLEDKLAPTKGTLIHFCLQKYYERRLKDPSGSETEHGLEAIVEMVNEIPKLTIQEEVKSLLSDELIACMDQYFTRWRGGSDFKPIAVEQPVQVEVRAPDGTVHIHTGIIDLVCEWHGGSLFIVDHKSTSMSFESVFKKYTHSLSFKGYCKAATQLYRKPLGVVVNAVRFKKNKALEVELEREPIMYDDAQLAEFDKSVVSIKREIEMCERDGFWPKASEQCIAAWGACEYFQLCKFDDPAMVKALYKGANR